MTLVHGDDFVSVGPREAARSFQKQLQARFEIKTQVIGDLVLDVSACASSGLGTSVERCVPEGRVLNRVVRWTPDGWEVETDQRHADLIVKELGLSEAKPVSTPGENGNREYDAENSGLLSAEDASNFRGLAARANYA